MVDQNCAYCVEGDLVAKFGIKICELETSKVYPVSYTHLTLPTN